MQHRIRIRSVTDVVSSPFPSNWHYFQIGVIHKPTTWSKLWVLEKDIFVFLKCLTLCSKPTQKLHVLQTLLNSPRTNEPEFTPYFTLNWNNSFLLKTACKKNSKITKLQTIKKLEQLIYYIYNLSGHWAYVP